MFRTRQAPSPTGFLHIGTARTVLFTKLMAKINNGIFYLRIEDTDRNRLQAGTVQILLNALSKIGLSAQEGVTLEKNGSPDSFYNVYQKGEFGPYIQSERLDIYHEHAQKLIDKKLAYWNYLSAEEKQELQEIKQVNKRPINYFKICLDKYGEEMLFANLQEGLSNLNKPVLMYRLQRESKIITTDILLGQTEFDLNLEEDFTILKSDGFPTYHLAHIIDDYLMKTSLVVRTQEWYSSLPKHVTMFQDYFGYAPEYMHAPVILGEVGNKKMSKRDGNVNLQDYLDKGYLPEAIVNYIAFLGWNPGTEKELYLEKADFLNLSEESRLAKLIDNLSQDFSLEKLSKSPARFSLEKLGWFNKQYINMLSLKDFVRESAELGFVNSPSNEEEKISSAKYLGWKLDQNRATLLSHIGLESEVLKNWVKPEFNDVVWKKSTSEETKFNLNIALKFIRENWEESIKLKNTLNNSLNEYLLNNNLEDNFNKSFNNLVEFWELGFKTYLNENNIQTGNMLWPLRFTLSGRSKSATPFELISILSLDEIEKRINLVIGK
jgi:glutamyl-tRNA synthetase